ncbi:hypothetical protein [Mesomycoplasma ovipneumoniae]
MPKKLKKSLKPKLEQKSQHLSVNFFCPGLSVRHIFRLNEIEKYFIKVADTVEQEKIAKLFETFDSLIVAYEQKVEYFKNLKTSFITKMFIY